MPAKLLEIRIKKRTTGFNNFYQSLSIISDFFLNLLPSTASSLNSNAPEYNFIFLTSDHMIPIEIVKILFINIYIRIHKLSRNK